MITPDRHQRAQVARELMRSQPGIEERARRDRKFALICSCITNLKTLKAEGFEIARSSAGRRRAINAGCTVELVRYDADVTIYQAQFVGSASHEVRIAVDGSWALCDCTDHEIHEHVCKHITRTIEHRFDGLALYFLQRLTQQEGNHP